MAALASQEWLANATTGATHMPIGVREKEDNVKVFVVNWRSQ